MDLPALADGENGLCNRSSKSRHLFFHVDKHLYPFILVSFS